MLDMLIQAAQWPLGIITATFFACATWNKFRMFCNALVYGNEYRVTAKSYLKGGLAGTIVFVILFVLGG